MALEMDKQYNMDSGQILSGNKYQFSEIRWGTKQYKDYSIGLKWPSDSIAESFSLWLTCIEMCWSISLLDFSGPLVYSEHFQTQALMCCCHS